MSALVPALIAGTSLAVVLAACAVGTVATDRLPASPTARIAVERSDDRLRLTALHEGAAGTTLSYRFEAARAGRAGQSRSAQSGQFTPGGEPSDTLSTLVVNIGPGDRVDASLTLLRGEDVVARDTFALELPAAP